MNKGLISAASAYILWGFLPIYWKQLSSLGANEILSHRIVWSLLFLGILLTLRSDWSWLREILKDRRKTLTIVFASILLAINWGLYIWGVNTDRIVEASLGYFINPLLSVVLGMIFFGETLRKKQVAAILVAVAGVLYLTWDYGRVPWLALSLAGSFGIYGVLKKQSPLNSIRGLTFEMTFLIVPALGYLLYLNMQGRGAFPSTSLSTNLFLIGAGVMTAVPLLCFAYGAQSVELKTMGLLQYFAPSLQFLIGIFLYGEEFSLSRLVGFALIWAALILYSAETIHFNQKTIQPQPTS